MSILLLLIDIFLMIFGNYENLVIIIIKAF